MTSEVRAVRLYLTGFMGAGKSTVGRDLAEGLGWPFEDLDELIEEEEGRTVPEIFEEDGEEGFRTLETEYLNSISERKAPFVVAVGGGVPMRDANRSIMQQTGVEVFLQVPFEVAYERIITSDHRPLVPDGPDARARLRDLWESRRERYRQAEWVIECNEDTPESIARRIEGKLRENQPGA